MVVVGVEVGVEVVVGVEVGVEVVVGVEVGVGVDVDVGVDIDVGVVVGVGVGVGVDVEVGVEVGVGVDVDVDVDVDVGVVVYMKTLKYIILILILVLTMVYWQIAVNAAPIPAAKGQLTVAILDTGLNLNWHQATHLCKTGHRNFTNEGSPLDPTDKNEYRHGSNITALIEREAKDAKYCIVIVKVISSTSTVIDYLQGLLYTLKMNPDFINISLNGEYPNQVEKLLIKMLLNNGVKIIVAAGNDSRDLTKKCKAFPACLDSRLVVVGNRDNLDSNLGGPIDVLENGVNQLGAGVSLSGTSQATAIHTGKLILQQWLKGGKK
jgi:hypothetical protein